MYGPVCTVVWEGRGREAPPLSRLPKRQKTREFANQLYRRGAKLGQEADFLDHRPKRVDSFVARNDVEDLFPRVGQ